MLSKRISRYIKSLQLKKYRKQEGSFIVEGAKGVTELLDSEFEIEYVLYTQEFENELINHPRYTLMEGVEVTQKELEQVGTFKSNNTALAVAKCSTQVKSEAENGLILVLDDVKDPGNLGTIIRVADWYGVNEIICSEESADFYNPKVINSSMGSFTRVKVCYSDIEAVLKNSDLPIFGAYIEGTNIYQTELPKDAIIVMGSESHGISESLKPLINHAISIPRKGGAESLNVAIATAVILDNFSR